MAHRNDQIGTTGVAITKSDTTSVYFVAIWVGTGGDLHVQHEVGTTVIYKNVPSGTPWCVAPVVRVMNATTAADMVGIKP